ncbi:hypothetical protein QP519_10695 [Weeksella virosa]|uniref:hypothetical protein n=1 Tax=Weeksella virosa TaxID=1014 RepID=UPI002553FF42|nr:hypothetical protein [Weeksella virosa]MDK7376002.1 hypothetical protein [Weeksella virosa]
MEYLFTHQILVSPHVKKYLTIMYGESYHLSQKDSIGIAILSFLQKDFKLIDHDLTESSESKKVLYPVTFSYHVFKNQGHSISHKQNVIIGTMLDKYFREQMYTFTLLHAMTKKSQWKDCMKKFLKIFDINEDDFELESFYKDFRRHKNENTKSPIYKLDKYLTEIECSSVMKKTNAQ